MRLDLLGITPTEAEQVEPLLASRCLVCHGSLQPGFWQAGIGPSDSRGHKSVIHSKTVFITGTQVHRGISAWCCHLAIRESYRALMKP